MPILRLVAEGVGPFEKLDLDLSDGKGNPHLGPHILAGVNGSGKSTVLKTIAWVLDRGWGFERDEWKHSTAGYRRSSAELKFKSPKGDVRTRYPQAWPGTIGKVDEWFQLYYPAAAYAPSRKLKYLANPDTAKSLSSPFENALAFGDTVRNDLVQAWLANLHSRPAIARETKQPAEKYVQALDRFESALRLIYDDKLRLVPELEPSLHPELEVGDQRLNFSQLPDGIRATIGWLADFMMRQDLMQWDARLKGRRPGVLLLDEIDAHLHPQWQRTLLPAMREALPDVQIIVTSHSPFVISSCPGSRVHVFEVDQDGRASLKQSDDAPVGQSVMAILKGIFGVESRFDVRTEKELDEWYQLSRKEAADSLSPAEQQRMAGLTETLAGRSEELRGIVSKPAGLPKSIESMLKALEPRGKTKSRQRKAG